MTTVVIAACSNKAPVVVVIGVASEPAPFCLLKSDRNFWPTTTHPAPNLFRLQCGSTITGLAFLMTASTPTMPVALVTEELMAVVLFLKNGRILAQAAIGHPGDRRTIIPAVVAAAVMVVLTRLILQRQSAECGSALLPARHPQRVPEILCILQLVAPTYFGILLS